MIKNMGKEYLNGKMDVNMLVVGNKINNMELVFI